MATTTTLNGTITAGAQQVTLAAFTDPRSTFGAEAMLQFTTGEICLITNATLSPTLSVVRGYRGTLAAAHTTNEGVVYGLMSDSTWPAYPQVTIPQPVLRGGGQVVTATGATGTTAATVIVQPPAFLDVTGASGAGVNLPIPAVGDEYAYRNNGTGAINFYCVGGTINTTTGTTAFAVTATGNLSGIFQCALAGTWKVAPQST